MAEAGQRDLPALVLNNLHQLMLISKTKVADKQVQVVTLKDWQRHHKDLQYKLLILQKQYEKQAQKQQAFLQRQSFLVHLEQHLNKQPHSNERTGRILWVRDQIAQQTTISTYNNNLSFKLQMLALEIDTIKFQIKKIEDDWLSDTDT